MTNEERQQYNRLSLEGKEEYNRLSNKYPNWSHKQIMTKLAFDETIEETVNSGGADVRTDDPTILTEILKKAKNFLQGIGCFFDEVFRKIDYFVDSISDALAKGISIVAKKLTEQFWQWIGK